jgi:hypothetical protein
MLWGVGNVPPGNCRSERPDRSTPPDVRLTTALLMIDKVEPNGLRKSSPTCQQG